MNNTIGQKIKNFRKRAGKSQFELELDIDASPGSISRIESGEVNPTKETLSKVIEALELSPLEASSLFNIDINSELNKYLDLAKSLNSNPTLDSTLDLITTDLIKFVNGKYSVIFLLNNETNHLEVASLNVPSAVRTICSEFIGYDLNKVKFDLLNPEDLKNKYVESFLSNKYVETASVYEASYPLLNKQLAQAVQKIAGVKLIVSLPIISNNKTIGVLGIVLKEAEVGDVEKTIINNFCDLISSAISRFVIDKYE